MLRKWFLIFLLIMIILPTAFASAADSVYMVVGEAKILSIKDITRIAISNSAVVEVVVIGGSELALSAKKPGLSMVNVWSHKNRVTYRLVVEEDYSATQAELVRLINNPAVTVTVTEKCIVLNGKVANSQEAEKLVQYGKLYRENVVNNLSAKSNRQILLSILVTELKKESEKKYGFNYGSWWPSQDGIVFHDWEAGLINNQNGVNLAPGTAIGALLSVMQKNGDAKILAAPSILTVGGKEALFLAGGEIPIPMSDGKGGTIVSWKEYGIKLKVTSGFENNNIISMAVSPEVSSIDWSNAIIVNGFKLPALATRKAVTNVLFHDGKTLIIGGLLKREDSTNIYKIPLLGDLPVIGALFRSKSFQKGDTELLLFVTPRIIEDDTDIDSTTLTTPANQGPYFHKAGENGG